MSSACELFFDHLARGLNETYWADGSPNRYHLLSKQLPPQDTIMLARGLCKLQSPRGEASLIPIVEVGGDWLVHVEGTERIALIVDSKDSPFSKVEEYVEKWGRKVETILTINGREAPSDWYVLRYDARQQSDIVASALEELFRAGNAGVPILARIRFENSGYEGLRGFLEEPEETASARNYELFYHRLARTWGFDGTEITSGMISSWVAQFAKDGFEKEAHYLLSYLHQWGYTTEDTLIGRVMSTYRGCVERFSTGRRARCIAIQETGKSEGKLAYRLKSESVCFDILSVAVEEAEATGIETDFYCFDDLVGTGDSIISCLFDAQRRPANGKLENLLRDGRAKVYVIAHDVSEVGKKQVESDGRSFGNVHVIGYRALGERDKVFSSESRVIGDAERRSAFGAYCAAIGETLFPGHGLGWKNGQLCLCYDYTIPDNSIPVLWGRSTLPREWVPLFERRR